MYLQNPDFGTTSKAIALKVLPIVPILQDVRIDGSEIIAGAMNMDWRPWVNGGGPPVHWQLVSPTKLAGLNITGEVTINSITNLIPATSFETISNISTLESWGFSTAVASGSAYSCLVKVYWNTQMTSEAFTLNVIDPNPQYSGDNLIVDIMTNKAVLSAGESGTAQANSQASGVTELFFISHAPRHIYRQMIDLDKCEKVNVSASQVSANASVTPGIKTNIPFTIPATMPRGIVVLRFRQNGKWISSGVRLAIAETTH